MTKRVVWECISQWSNRDAGRVGGFYMSKELARIAGNHSRKSFVVRRALVSQELYDKIKTKPITEV